MMNTTIPLGFAVPGGEPVAIPLGHMAVVGQTQMAGKTTCLDALAHRVKCPVLAFITKRGEGAFDAQHTATHAPYFRERADWQFVEAVLEATMRERMKYERGWIMKICRGMKTLRDVQRNCKAEAHRTKSQFARDMYEKLDAYFDIVVPQIGHVRWAAGLSLTPGLNVMSLTGFTSEVQALILGSCLDYVQQHLRDTIVVIPEAWEFLPRARKSPVTLAAETLVRKGAALRNYLWIDSQDLAGVHTPILKSMHVWLLGVQREINEIKRTLAHVHGIPKKPKPDQIAELGLGQFIACFGSTAVTTYVQPAWLTGDVAQRVARGEITRAYPYRDGTGKVHPVGFSGFKTAEQWQAQEDPMDVKVHEENERLQQARIGDSEIINRLMTENEQLHVQVTALEDAIRALGQQLAEPDVPDKRRHGTTPLRGRPLDEDGGIEFRKPSPLPLDQGEFYATFRARILADATVLAAVAKITALRPEILIELEPRTVTFDGASAKGRLARMVANGLFDQPAKPGVAIKEFARTGGAIHPSRLSEYLSEFVSSGFLLREGDLYVKAPALKVTTRELSAV